jgi:UDP-N-acetylmuramyl pentapeptide phosphotransferase/UDP-N-acetylglucosamine-1-phosphate transferase
MIETDNLFLVSLVCLLVTCLCTFFFIKQKLLIDDKNYSEHKRLIQNINSSPPLCGGIIIFTSSLIFFQDLNYLNIFGFLLLVVGIFSDSNKVSSPAIRIILQLTIFISFVTIMNLNLTDLRIDFFNKLLSIKIVSIIFTTFCILVLVNGSNFLDGLNTLVVGYYILVCSFLLILSNNYNFIINYNIILLLIFLIIVYLFNFFGKLYLGDSGSYLISLYVAYFVLEFALKNELPSPYLICFLLWYPAFENLFSIIRRSNLNKEVHLPDQKHLHQMIYKFFINSKLINNNIANSFSANLINLFNLIMFIFFYNYYNETNVLFFGIGINIFLYLIFYFLLKKKLTQNLQDE